MSYAIKYYFVRWNSSGLDHIGHASTEREAIEDARREVSQSQQPGAHALVTDTDSGQSVGTMSKKGWKRVGKRAARAKKVTTSVVGRRARAKEKLAMIPAHSRGTIEGLSQGYYQVRWDVRPQSVMSVIASAIEVD